MRFENISASYDVGIAREFGIPSAVLLNKLLYLSKNTTREDGFCWRTAKELEDELGLTRTQQELAIKKLEDAGIIETKNTFIIGTQIKCKHFRVIDFHERCKSDFHETLKSEIHETLKSVNNNKTIIKDNNIYKEVQHKYGTNGRVLLTDKQYEKLVNDYGEDIIKEKIELLDEYLQMNNNKNKYKDFNAVLRKAIRENWWSKQTYKKQNTQPSWLGKEIKKEEISDEAKRIAKYIRGED